MSSSLSQPTESASSDPQLAGEETQPFVDATHFRFGRLDAADERNFELLRTVEVQEDRMAADHAQVSKTSGIMDPNPNSTDRLSKLPCELIDRIFCFVGPLELVALAKTSRLLRSRADGDAIWRNCVQSFVPGTTVAKTGSFATYKKLYISQDPFWFLPKYKIWFSDYTLTGKIIIVRYDPVRACIEGYRLVCERGPPDFFPWEHDELVLVHSFSPRPRLHLDQPILQLDPILPSTLLPPSHTRFRTEVAMEIEERNQNGIFQNLLLTRPVPEHPGMALWPPKTIPAKHRVRNVSHDGFTSVGHRPERRTQISDQSFRIRRWMELASSNPGVRIRMGEETYTYSTLDHKLYTPTDTKPWRGIWVGDYSGHGCEFLLMHQPDNTVHFDETSVVQRADETPAEFEQRKKGETLYRGSLEAIKLTGDPNIPRGEHTFVVDDLSDLIRVADEEIFKGARIVKSRGHVAKRLFRDDMYIESQLIMISHDVLAQYWVEFGHISYYHRVDIDQFLTPSSTS